MFNVQNQGLKNVYRMSSVRAVYWLFYFTIIIKILCLINFLKVISFVLYRA